MTTAILLINLGTPKKLTKKEVFLYLNEFLTDRRVIDIPWLARQLLVRGIITPFRYRTSTKNYKTIWKKEGSPLLLHMNSVRQKLQDLLGSSFRVELAMRYKEPSIEQGLRACLSKPIKHLIIFPLFPQYASATTGSIYEKVMDVLREELSLPELTFINNFATHPAFIAALAAKARTHELPSYDHYLFSFHGLPTRQLGKSDRFSHCLKEKDCCKQLCPKNQNCYAAQCHATARALIEELDLPTNQCSITFQSRLGKEQWLQPYTNETICNLARAGKKRVLVFCPAFVCDCLETTFEMGIENREEFLHLGGEKLDLVEGLNDHPLWINALQTIIREKVGQRATLQTAHI